MSINNKYLYLYSFEKILYLLGVRDARLLTCWARGRDFWRFSSINFVHVLKTHDKYPGKIFSISKKIYMIKDTILSFFSVFV